MADKGFGVKEINLIGASGTPTIESPNNINLNAVNVAISTNTTVGGTATFGGNVDIADTIYHTGDSNTKIRFPANDTITFHTSGNEHFRIDSSGNIGQAVTPSGWASAQAGDFYAYQIGTGFAAFGRGSGDLDRGGISVNYYNTAAAQKYIGNGHAGRIYFEDGSIVFSNAAQNSSGAGAAMTLNERFKIASDGTISIGKGDESSAVENLVELYVGGSNGSHATIRGKYNRTNGYNRSEVRFGVEDNSAGKGFLAFATGTNSASERMRIQSNGNTDIYANQVHLYNSVDTSNTYFVAQNTGAGNAGIRMKNNAGDFVIIANDRLRFYDLENSQERLAIESDGTVSVNPVRGYDNGILRVYGTNAGTAGVIAGGTTSGQSTGYMEVNQDGVHGGGMFYNGDGTPSFATGESTDQFSLYRNHNGSRNVLVQWPYDSNDSTFKGNMLVDNGSSTIIRVRGDNDGTAGISCGGQQGGQTQCTGYVEVHQDEIHGGGISYNGDGSPSFCTQEGADRITYWRMQNGSRQEVFSYPYSDNNIRFRGDLRPASNNNVDLGSNSIRWRDVYCNQGAFNNSDETLKQDIASLTTAEMNVAKRLSGLFKTYRWKDAVVKKGTDKARTHTGIIAQQIVAAMEAEGVDYTKYGFIGYGEWYENDEGEVIELDKADDSNLDGYTKVGRYSVRYTELLSFIAAYNDQRFVDLETRVAALES